jgi:hypothetical protein
MERFRAVVFEFVEAGRDPRMRVLIARRLQ